MKEDSKIQCQFCSGFETKLRPRAQAEPEKIKLQNEMEIPLEDASEHEVISRIAEQLGDSPADLARAEHLYHMFKYQITKNILFTEYNQEHSLSLSLALWLEGRIAPDKQESIHKLAENYLSNP